MAKDHKTGTLPQSAGTSLPSKSPPSNGKTIDVPSSAPQTSPALPESTPDAPIQVSALNGFRGGNLFRLLAEKKIQPKFSGGSLPTLAPTDEQIGHEWLVRFVGIEVADSGDRFFTVGTFDILDPERFNPADPNASRDSSCTLPVGFSIAECFGKAEYPDRLDGRSKDRKVLEHGSPEVKGKILPGAVCVLKYMGKGFSKKNDRHFSNWQVFAV